MGLLNCLCGKPSTDNLAPRPAVASEKPSSTNDTPQLGSNDEDSSKDHGPIGDLPRHPTEFIQYLHSINGTPKQDHLRPYLEYEGWLRKAFAQGQTKLNDKVNLVPVYAGDEKLFKSKAVDRESTSDSDKYLMRLPASGVSELSDELAIAPTTQQYRRNFECFTHRCLVGLDWSNIVVAGSAAMLPLLPQRQDVNFRHQPSEADPLETYYEYTAGSSDIDIFIYGLDENAAIDKIKGIEATLRKNQRLGLQGGMALRTANAVTLVAPRWPHRHVQIILRLYKSISEVLTGFDVDCACVAFDGSQVYTTPRGATAIATHTNIIDLTRRSPSYENRLYKYRSHNFDAYWPLLDRSKINPGRCTRTEENPQVYGLSRLIFFEEVLKHRSGGHRAGYRQKRRLKKIDENGEPTHSGYAILEVPYGQKFSARRVQNFISRHSKEPHVFGDIQTVLETGATKSSKKRNRTAQLEGRVKFLEDNPGRQMIGSFYPLTKDDWTEQAYAEDDS